MAMKNFRASRADRGGRKPRSVLLAVSKSDSTAITGTTETQANFDNKVTIPANQLRVGSRIRGMGYVKHTATTGTETHDILLVLGSTTLATIATIDPANNNVMLLEWDLVISAVGASGTIWGSVKWKATGAAATAGNAQIIVVDNATLDTTAANDMAIAIDRQAAATDSDSAKVPGFVCDITL